MFTIFLLNQRQLTISEYCKNVGVVQLWEMKNALGTVETIEQQMGLGKKKYTCIYSYSHHEGNAFLHSKIPFFQNCGASMFFTLFHFVISEEPIL